MTHTLDLAEGTDGWTAPGPALGELRLGDPGREHEIDSFLAELHQMTPAERINASRYTMKRWEYWVYAARFRDEVPTVNGELELIAATLE